MKKCAVFLMCLIIILTMVACGKKPKMESETEPTPTERYRIYPIDWILPKISTKYETLEEAENAVGLRMGIPEMDASLTPLYYTSGDMLRVHFAHFLDGLPHVEGLEQMQEVDQDVMLMKIPKPEENTSNWDMYARSNIFSEEKVVYVYDYPMTIQYLDGEIKDAFWSTGDVGYLIDFDHTSATFGNFSVADLIKMAETMCAEDYAVCTSASTHKSFSDQTVENLQNKCYPTLAQAEEAIGFQIDLPEMPDTYNPEYHTNARYRSYDDFKGELCPELPEYWIGVRYAQYEQDKEEFLPRKAKKTVTFFKSTWRVHWETKTDNSDGWADFLYYAPEENTILVQDIPVIIGFENGKIVQARWNTRDFGYAVLIKGGEFQEDDIRSIVTTMSGGDRKPVYSDMYDETETEPRYMTWVRYDTLEDGISATGIDFTIPEMPQGFQMDCDANIGRHGIRAWGCRIKEDGASCVVEDILIRKIFGTETLGTDDCTYDTEKVVTIDGNEVTICMQGENVVQAYWYDGAYSFCLEFREFKAWFETAVEMIQQIH